jgi:DNA-binding response OmpR family regulator
VRCCRGVRAVGFRFPFAIAWRESMYPHQKTAETPAPLAHDAPGIAHGSDRRILVVDDEKNVRFTVAHALRSDGYTVDSAGSGTEGLDCTSATRYDLILVDLRMPGMTGIDMLRELRRRDPEMPAVIITAYGVPQQLVEAAELGAIDCIHKPFSIQTIRSVVREVIDRAEGETAEATTASEYMRSAKRAIMHGEFDEAHAALERAKELDPRDCEPHLLDGIVALLKQDDETARERFRKALQIDPTNKNASEYLAFYGR